MKKWDYIIIGGGAAGIMAAITAKKNSNKVLLLEKNKQLGQKLAITGKGRCNISNAAPLEQFMQNIISNKSFLYSALTAFNANDLQLLLKDLGIRTVLERGGRIFPQNVDAQGLRARLSSYLTELSVEVKQAEVSQILIDSVPQVQGVKTLQGHIYQGDRVVLATGGQAYPHTGSDGGGYQLAQRLGHLINAPKPALVPLTIKDKWVKNLKGLHLKNIELKLLSDNEKIIYQQLGEVVFGDNFLTGPLALSASSYLAAFASKKPVIYLDLKPGLDLQTLDQRLLKDFALYSNKAFKNALDDLLPQQIIPTLIELSSIDPYQVVHQISKSERQGLIELIKNLKMEISGTKGFKEAIITKGGVSVKEIKPSTMESKLISQLYFAGEIIDVDALTGGFNLQIAFSTGYCAANN